MEKKKVQSYYDITLVLLTIFLCVFGLVMIYSTSSYNAYRFYGDSQLYLKRQALFFALGLFVMIVVSMIDYHIYIRPFGRIKIRLVTLLFVLCIGLLGYVTVAGHVAGGSSRWIPIAAGFNLQPSEIFKISMILFVAYTVSIMPKSLNKVSGFLRVALYVALPIGLVADENLSTAIILVVIVMGMCFVVSRKTMYFLMFGFGAMGLGALAIAFVGYRSDRIAVWLDVEAHPKGYQIMQGLYAIASGGLWGKGLGESMQKLGNIPEAHTDMIFSVICEELGVIGGIAVIGLFLMMIWRLFKIAINAPDIYGGMIATGVMIHIAIQVLINIAVVTNSIPSTGIPLPFISYGGSSLLVLMAEIGLALSVSNHTVRELDA